MKTFAIIGLVLAASYSLTNGLALNYAKGSVQEAEALEAVEEKQEPKPYSFSYSSDLDSRNEAGDSLGTVQGMYSIKGEDGVQRIVRYIADKKGFQANITTNEPGTESQNPAYIKLSSSQLPAAEISKKAQEEIDLAESAEPLREKAVSAPQDAPRKAARLPKQQQQQQQLQALAARTKGRRPAQQPQAVSAPPAKRPAAAAAGAASAAAASPAKGGLRRQPSKSVATPLSTQAPSLPKPAQRPRSFAVSKRPSPVAQAAVEPQEQAEEEEPLPALNAEQEELVEDSQDES